MPLDRRALLAAGMTAATATTAAAAVGPRSADRGTPAAGPTPGDLGLDPASPADQTRPLQAAIDLCAERRVPLNLPSGRYATGALELRPGTRLVGSGAGLSVLAYTGGGRLLFARDAKGLSLSALTLDGSRLALDPEAGAGLLSLAGCRDLVLDDVAVTGSLLSGIVLAACSGRIADCSVTEASDTGIWSHDGEGLEIAHCRIADCGNNGIQVWRASPGEDATIVTANRIERIASKSGGTGQNGNGIACFRAGGVLVTGNRIADCAYSAIRANSSSNVQMVANNCARLGEVALYSEFAFEGALIASNVVDVAAAGISVTNFDYGGRLAVLQGNLIRNIRLRADDPEDQRGVGIYVEADTVLTGNVIEGAPNYGIMVGWGPARRDLVVTQNLIRNARIGIGVNARRDAGTCLIANNLISGARDGAIRYFDAAGEPTGPELVGGTSDPSVTISGNRAA